MPTIRQLSASLVNKIAAGEVIERPASVVKELMENAVDSGATRIAVSIAQGGGELIRVVDNGCGIHHQQLALAVASHATSKIAEADDLFRVKTLGFRGEALASISEVSRMVLRSRTADSPAGAELEVTGGRLGEVAPCGCPEGTTVEVHQLFYNTPVRRKFLRTTQTETGHATEAFNRIALAWPEIHFSLEHNGRQLADLPPAADWRARIAVLYGADLAESLLWVESDGSGPVQLAGYVANPSHSRANNRLQFLFLNGRFIRDRALQHALGEAYRGLLTVGRHPIAFLRLNMPPDLVDVNVHPTKLEVRFQDSGALYSQLLGTLRETFLTTDLTARFDPARENDPARAHDPSRADAMRREIVQWAKAELAQQAAAPAESALAPQQLSFPADERPPQAPLTLNRLPQAGPQPPHFSTSEPRSESTASDAEAPGLAGAGLVRSRDGAAALQVMNRYLVAESAEGIVVIDQHALHERVLYEQLREKVLAGQIEVQKMLVPEPVDLAPAEATALLEAAELLAELGLRIEPFGGGTLLVSGYPAMLWRLSPAEMLGALADHLLSKDKPPDRRDLLDEVLHGLACRAAVKAGDRLSGEEVGALLEQRHLAQDAHHCPHGRPTSLVLTRAELDRQFKRT